MSNIRGLSHLNERVRVKNLAHEHRIRLVSWNIGSVINELVELVDVIIRRKVNILCMQESKWIDKKTISHRVLGL